MNIILTVLCGLYGTYCFSFIGAVCYTICKEKAEERRNKRRNKRRNRRRNQRHNQIHNQRRDQPYEDSNENYTKISEIDEFTDSDDEN